MRGTRLAPVFFIRTDRALSSMTVPQPFSQTEAFSLPPSRLSQKPPYPHRNSPPTHLLTPQRVSPYQNTLHGKMACYSFPGSSFSSFIFLSQLQHRPCQNKEFALEFWNSAISFIKRDEGIFPPLDKPIIITTENKQGRGRAYTCWPKLSLRNVA